MWTLKINDVLWTQHAGEIRLPTFTAAFLLLLSVFRSRLYWNQFGEFFLNDSDGWFSPVAEIEFHPF